MTRTVPIERSIRELFDPRLVLWTLGAAAIVLGLLSYGAVLREDESRQTRSTAAIVNLVADVRYEAMEIIERARDVIQARPGREEILARQELATATGRLVALGDMAASLSSAPLLRDSLGHANRLAALRRHIVETAAAARTVDALAGHSLQSDRSVMDAVRSASQAMVDWTRSFNRGLVGDLAPSLQADAHQKQNLVSLATIFAFLVFIAMVVFPASRRLREASDRFDEQAAQFARLALIAQRTSNAVIISDRQGRIEWVNEGFRRITGYDLDEIKGRTAGEFLNHEGTDPATVARLESAVRDGRPIRCEIENRGKFGQIYWMDVEIQPLTDSTGTVTGFMAIETDITVTKMAHVALASHNKDLAMVAEVAGVGPWRIDLVKRTVWWSDAVRKIHEVDDNYVPTIEAASTFYPEDARRRLLATIRASIRTGTNWRIELPFVSATGRRLMVRVTGSVQYAHNRAVAVIGAFQDITVEAEARSTIHSMRERLEMATTSANIGLWDADVLNEKYWFDEHFWVLLGYNPKTRPRTLPEFDILIHPDDLVHVNAVWDASMAADGVPYTAQFRIRDGAGAWRWIESAGRCTARMANGKASRMCGVMIDIHQRKSAEEQRAKDQERLWSLANLDALTGLSNRSLLASQLEDLVRRSGRRNRGAVIGVVDLDRFKEVNDSFGHVIGDEYLRKIADRMRKAVRVSDVLGRLGGDEFAFVLGNIASEAEAERRVKRLLKAICDPVDLSNSARRGGGSIGYAVFPQDGTTTSDLLRRADVALYDAKASGRRIQRRFASQMEDRLADGHGQRNDFEAALESDQILVFYQPIITADESEVTGFEALARWNHPVKGVVGPSVFQSALAEPDLAKKLGKRVRAKVIETIIGWRREGVGFGRVSINLAASDFADGGVVDDLSAAIDAGTIEARDLCLEITEGVLLDGNLNERIHKELTTLKSIGFEIAFDDFGTGYASLSHLREYPIDRIKIDRSFVMNLPGHVRDYEIVRTIGILGEALGLDITAEGIETKEQAEIARRLGATDLQGFAFGKPMHPDRVAGYLSRFSAERSRADERAVA